MEASKFAALRRFGVESARECLSIDGLYAVDGRLDAEPLAKADHRAAWSASDASAILCQRKAEIAFRASFEAGESIEQQDAAFATAWYDAWRQQAERLAQLLSA